MPYRRLDADKIVDTIQVLRQRVSERFPDAGLTRVCEELLLLAEGARVYRGKLGRPNFVLRFTAAAVIGAMAAGLVALVGSLEFKTSMREWPVLIQGLEAAVNELVLFGAASFFFLTLETRLKRRGTLRKLHELRSLAHVIDMHQMTKDPESVVSGGPHTGSSPKRSLTTFELCRYLDYCTEMLSLAGKIAALYGEEMSDDVILSAVDSVEDLTTSLSGKIWQKLVIVTNDLRTVGPALTS